MKILYASSEIVPFAATGGLGDVIGALPAVIKKNNEDWDVRALCRLLKNKREYALNDFEKWNGFVLEKTYCGISRSEKTA